MMANFREDLDNVGDAYEALDEVSTTGEALDSARIVILNQCFLIKVPPPLILSNFPSVFKLELTHPIVS